MRRSRPDLIVPIRDRRQHRRILTLRNFRNACFVLVALFAGITIEANLRKSTPADDFGRLMSPRVESPTSLPKHPELVQPQPIEDQTVADPTLVQAMNRSQILRDEARVVPAAPPASQGRPEAGNTPVIVGGPDGVTILQADPQHPILHGGFGR